MNKEQTLKPLQRINDRIERQNGGRKFNKEKC